MQLIRDIYASRKGSGRPVISMEFFPPKTEEGERRFFAETVPALNVLKPDYCSVTYGAGGGTRHKTIAMVDRIQREHALTTLAHLTCVGSTREQIREILDEARAAGVRNILALRGDPPPGTAFAKPEGGFEHAAELVRFIRAEEGFGVGVAGFPEGHPACREGKLADWRHLKAKIDAGADFVITQLFFDNRDFFELRDYLTALGVTVPLVPGIIAILSASQIRKFVSLCGARLPQALQRELDLRAGDDAAAAEFGVEYASRQCQELLAAGVPGLHFYTLNKAQSATRILRNLGLV
ncbi:MAG: methylenetetrahydrofolate reductase [NAD(P)H] [Verrucomicrobia bacterium]|jgi:methylenetetrahydrofolate reductase (NADPH)|nr:methylenetetrahydrofolate reductase [NAD(P)H] [Verrucomicrobiota bacterium]